MSAPETVPEPGNREIARPAFFKKGVLVKIVRKHVVGENGSSPEPWGELLSTGTIEDFKHSETGAPASWEELRAVILKQAGCSCERPLVVTYREHLSESLVQTHWALVCPSGLLVVGVKTDRGFQIRTAYFKRETLRADGNIRWWTLAEHLVDQYCVPEGGRMFHPEPADTRTFERQTIRISFDVVQDRIEFVSREQWGFRSDSRAGRTYFGYDLRNRPWSEKCRHVAAPEQPIHGRAVGRPRRHSR